jgi:hypothetical protein
MPEVLAQVDGYATNKPFLYSEPKGFKSRLWHGVDKVGAASVARPTEQTALRPSTGGRFAQAWRRYQRKASCYTDALAHCQ